MSEQGAGRRELVFCHACENEWLRGDHGLECPQCHSDVVEIVSYSILLPQAPCGSIDMFNAEWHEDPLVVEANHITAD